ncbi:MAG TPA: hypothetical protein VFX10_01265, partial [Nitrospira sp.]|nr:hypothetical protein [Nitrospira sp.]
HALRTMSTAPSKLDVAGLHYVGVSQPGISRRRRGGGFAYFHPDGRAVRDKETLTRIRSLVIPPAWQDIWICRDAQGHIQAIGRDAKGRKQYRYHPTWRVLRDGNKYDRMAAFGRSLPMIRRRVESDLALPGLPREKILATIVRLLDVTLIRVGNEEYARQNDSFGLATLRDRHVAVNGTNIHFEFVGKSGIRHAVDVRDRRLASIIRKSRDLPGYELFQYLDERGARHTVNAADVNEYLKRIAKDEFTAKDFRTWAGTVLAARALSLSPPWTSHREAKRRIVRAVEVVARQLRNTKAICRKCYIHPDIITAYLNGRLSRPRKGTTERRGRETCPLSSEESAVLAILERRS